MRLKKTLAAFLVVCLGLAFVAAAVPVAAQEADFKDSAKIKNTQAVDTMVELNIINGKGDNLFEPEAIVTRAEMAKMISVALNGGKDPTLGSTANPVFADTQEHWASEYIAYCAGLGIIAGAGDGRFAPDAPVTGMQAAKMLMVALGYDADIEGFVGNGWAKNVSTVAGAKNLYAELAIDPNAGLSRDNAAQLMYNGLQEAVVKYSSGEDGEKTAVETEDTILKAKYNMLSTAGILTHISYDAAKEEYTYTILGSDGQSKQLVAPDDYSEFFGMNCTAIYKQSQTKNEAHGIYPKDSEAILTLTGWELEDAARSADSSFEREGKTYEASCKMAQLPVYYYNSWSKTGLSAAISSIYPFEMKLIDNSGDGKIDLAVAYPKSVAKVSSVGSDSVSFNTLYGSYISPVNTADIKAELAVGDYVIATPAQYTAKGAAKIQKTEPLKGTLSGFADGKMTIDGKAYLYTGGMSATVTGREEPFALLGDVVVWREYKPVYIPPVQKYDVALLTSYEVNEETEETATASLLFSDGTSTQEDGVAVKHNALLHDWVGGLVAYKVSGDVYTFYPCNADLAASKIRMKRIIAAPQGAADEISAVFARTEAVPTATYVPKINQIGFANEAVIFVKKTVNEGISYSIESVEELLMYNYSVINAYTNSSDKIALAYLEPEPSVPVQQE